MNLKIELPIETIKDEYIDGMSLNQLALKYSVSKVVIYNRLSEMGIDHSYIQKQHRDKRILELWEKTNDKKLIAKTVKCSLRTVYNVLDGKGLCHEHYRT